MGAARKFKEDYPREEVSEKKSDLKKDKAVAEELLKRVQELVEKDEDYAKKAAQIISELLK